MPLKLLLVARRSIDLRATDRHPNRIQKQKKIIQKSHQILMKWIPRFINYSAET